jgi:hypothetical protein
MGYVVHIWEHPEPASLAAADWLHESLAGRPSPRHAKWQRLRDAVESRMAALGVPMEWAEDPIDADHQERTYGLLFDGPEGFEQVLVQSATSLGFSVYDDQAARLYLPFGYVLTERGISRMNWGDGVPPLPRIGGGEREAAMARCEAAWRPRFEALGFSLRRGEPFRDGIALVAERAVPAGRQAIEMNFSVYEDRLSCDVVAATLPDMADAVRQACGGVQQIQVRGREYRGMAAFMIDRGRDPVSVGGTLRTEAHVERLVEGVFEYLGDEVLPTLDRCTTADGVLQLALHPGAAPGVLRPSRLTLALAWLAGDAMLERVLAECARNHPEWHQDWGQQVSTALNALPQDLRA